MKSRDGCLASAESQGMGARDAKFDCPIPELGMQEEKGVRRVVRVGESCIFGSDCLVCMQSLFC